MHCNILMCLVALSISSTPSQVGNDPLFVESVQRATLLAQQVTITRDEFGVPHVHAKTDAGAVFGGMYARAEDEMYRIEMAYAMMTARACLFHGQTYVPWDRMVYAFELPALSQQAVGKAPAEVRALLQAGADALNFYLHRHREYKPKAIEIWEPWMLLCGDYAWGLYMAQAEIQRVQREFSKSPATSSHFALPPDVGLKYAIDGSNAWAIGPSRTASRQAMLYINPHIPLDEPYEIHLRSEEGLHVSGLVAYGTGLLPFAGFNERLGWTLTVNYVDIADAYAVEIDAKQTPPVYKFGDKSLPVSASTDTIRIRTDSGITSLKFRSVRTHHGPIIHQSGSKSIAVRFAKCDAPCALEQWYGMAKARNLTEWKKAVGKFGVVFHNFVYADADGNIGYVYNAAFPRRDESFDWSKTLNGADPKTEWQGYHKLEDLIQVWNPRCGYVQNCNSAPFMTCATGENPDRAKYPRSMVGNDMVDGRVAMSHKILGAAKGWKLDDLERAAFDPTAHQLETTRKPLLADFEKYQAIAPDAAKRLAPAIEAIRTWDGKLTVDAIPATLYSLWIEKLFSPTWLKRRSPGDLSIALSEVMAELERDFKTWRVPWGDLNRHQRFDNSANLRCSDTRESLPIGAGHAALGVSFCYLSRANSSKRHYGYHGHSYVAAVEFGKEVEARSILPFGESRHPNSPHFNDQAALYASGRMKHVRFSAKSIQTGANRSYHPGS